MSEPVDDELYDLAMVLHGAYCSGENCEPVEFDLDAAAAARAFIRSLPPAERAAICQCGDDDA